MTNNISKKDLSDNELLMSINFFKDLTYTTKEAIICLEETVLNADSYKQIENLKSKIIIANFVLQFYEKGIKTFEKELKKR